MRLMTPLAAAAVLAAGSVGAATAYQLAAPPGAAPESAAVDTTRQRGQPERPRFAPCRPPAELQGRRCVEDVVRTVLLPGADTGSPPLAPAPRASTTPVNDHHDDHGGGDDHGGDDHDHDREDDGRDDQDEDDHDHDRDDHDEDDHDRNEDEGDD